DDCSPRTAPCFRLGGNDARCFENARRSADVVGGARTPAVAMSANDHELVWKLAPANDAEGVPDWLEWLRIDIGLHLYSRHDRPGPDMISEWQASLPARRNLMTGDSGQQLRRVSV